MKSTLNHVEFVYLVTTVSNAVYNECFGMPDYMEFTKENVIDSVLEAINGNHLDQLYDYMLDLYDSENMPETKKALEAIKGVL